MGGVALEVEKDPYGMSQDFADQTMLKMPQIMHAQAGDGKALGQMRAHGFYSLAQTGTELEQRGTMGRGHPFAWGGYDEDTMPLGQQGLAKGIDKAFVGGDQPGKARRPGRPTTGCHEAGGQEGTTGDHPTAGDAQAQLEAIVVQLLGGTVAIIGKRLEAAVAATAGVATDRQGQRINDLHRVSCLPTHLGQPLLNGRFDLPEVSGLPNKQCPVRQLRKEVGIVGAKVGKEVLVGGQLEILAADLQVMTSSSLRAGAKPPRRNG